MWLIRGPPKLGLRLAPGLVWKHLTGPRALSRYGSPYVLV